ncbi:MAG TPA: hypothetical protein PLC48_01810, partial [Ferruginibacter sp.]|nr:hypothetical protein [Ferruginibacter sp.]
QNLFVRFAGVSDSNTVKIGIKESDRMIDFVTVKSYVFPYINLVWFGLVIMSMGLFMSMLKRAGQSGILAAILLAAVTAAIFYMFLLAN